MGTDKASLVVDGQPMAARIADLLSAACRGPVLEVGPGYSRLLSLTEDPAGEGPLVAVAAGAAALRRKGWLGPALVLSCDLPAITRPVLDWLAGSPGEGAVVPVVGGRRQPLCARWSAADLSAAGWLAGAGQRSLRGLPGARPCRLADERTWGPVAGAEAFADADTPEDLAGLAVVRPGPGGL
jgi:molybdopterin-guanine dinucleotide biosynthesis protein A